MSDMIQTLADVKDDRVLIPATSNVKMMVKKIDVRDTTKDGAIADWRTLNIQLQVVDGIDDEGKYKNTIVFGSVCYYVNPESVSKNTGKKHSEQDYYKRRFSDLKGFVKAIGDDLSAVSVDEESITTYVKALAEGAVGKMVVANITQKKGQGDYEDSNEVKYFKPVASEDLV